MSTWKAHPKTDLIRYLEGELNENQKHEVSQHLADCEECEEFVSFARDFNDGLSEIAKEDFTSKEPCPDSWTLASFEAGKEDEETARHLRAHLLFCDECAEMYYALRRARGPSWTRIVFRAVEDLLECVSITGAGELLQPLPSAVGLRGEPVPRAGTIHVEAAATDPDTGTTTLRLQVDANPNKPEATILLEAKPLQRGWKAYLLDAQGQEVTSVPLVQAQTAIASGLPYGLYFLNLYKGENSLASFELDMRAS